MKVALVHDYLTQRGGAERVVLSLMRAFPDAPVYTSLFQPETTFDEFADADVRVLPLDRSQFLRHDHRRALPLLAPAFSRLHVDADVLVCSSSGWAHGAHTSGAKVVYCHTPPRWLYQPGRYLGERAPAVARVALGALRRPLLAWDRRAARDADRYVANSRVVRDRIADAYGLDADVVPPPPAVAVEGPETALAGVDQPFVLCVARLLPYKNVEAVVTAAGKAGVTLVVAGTGPLEDRVRRDAPAGVVVAGRVDDEVLRWLYRRCAAVVAASYEDFGLTPLEAASFGRPAAVLRYGGFLDTVDEDVNGVFFDEPEPHLIAAALERVLAREWDTARIEAHAAAFSEQRFVERMRRVVEEAAHG